MAEDDKNMAVDEVDETPSEDAATTNEEGSSSDAATGDEEPATNDDDEESKSVATSANNDDEADEDMDESKHSEEELEEEEETKSVAASDANETSSSPMVTEETTESATPEALVAPPPKKKRGKPQIPASARKGRAPAVKGLNIPFRTVKKAMKLDPDIPIVQNEAAIMTTLAAELFLKRLADQSQKICKNRGKNTIRYEDVADARANDPSLAFLKTIIP